MNMLAKSKQNIVSVLSVLLTLWWYIRHVTFRTWLTFKVRSGTTQSEHTLDSSGTTQSEHTLDSSNHSKELYQTKPSISHPVSIPTQAILPESLKSYIS